MSKIDCDAYLKTLGTVNVNQLEIIKEYLEKQCQTDEALRAVYNPEKIKDCYDFIVNCARKSTTDNRACLKSEVVFKMARDYFIEILPAIPETTDDQSEQKAKTENKKAEKKNKTEQKAEEKPVDVAPVQETVKEVCEQIEADSASDNVKRDKYGFEIFGEEADEPEESEEETVEEPVIYEGEGEDEIVQTIVEDDCITVTGRPKTEEAAEDVFFSGQAFNAGDIIDRHGRRLLFCELKVGMRFILENKLNEDDYMVGVVKKVLDDMIVYDSYKERQYAYKKYIDDEFPCIDNEPGGWCFAVPKNAMILGWQKDNEGEMYGELRAPVTDYDTEGNGLLFGF